MAGDKIIDLTAITTQSATDISETSLNGAGSRRETRLQADTYTKNFISSKQITPLTTSVTITAAQIISGIIRLNPADASQTFTFPTKASLYSAWGSPPIDSTINCQFPNISAFLATLAASDLTVTGMPTLVIPKKSTFDLIFTVTGLSPTVINVTGGFVDTAGTGDMVGPASATDNAAVTFNGTTGKLVKDSSFLINAAGSVSAINSSITALNTRVAFQNATVVYVDVNGSNATGNGTILNPYATIAFANTAISASATVSNRFIIDVSGEHSESSLNVYPYVTVRGSGKYGNLISFSSVDLDDTAWSSPNDISGFVDCNLEITDAFVGNNPQFEPQAFFFDNCNVTMNLTYGSVDNQGFIFYFNNTQIRGFDGNTTCINITNSHITRINSPVFTKQLKCLSNTYATIDLALSSPCFEGHSIGGNNATAQYDAVSLRPTVDSGTPTRTMISVDTVDIQTTQTITGNKEFSGLSTFSGDASFTGDVLTKFTESSYSTTTTISADDLVTKKILICNAVGAITLTLPSAADIETSLGFSPSVGLSITGIQIVNVSVAGTVTIANGTGTTVGGMANSTIASSSNRTGIILRKSAATPSYIIYG